MTRAFLDADGAGPDELANLFQDIVRRGHLPGRAMKALSESMSTGPEASAEHDVIQRCVDRFAALGAARSYRPAAPPANFDYIRIWERFKARA